MAFDAHANFATSLVATAPSPASSGTSLVVTAAEGARFPAVPFNAVIGPANTLLTPANAEIVRVTARSTDTLTIARAQESSSARTVVIGDQVFCGPTAKTFTDLEVVDAAAGTGSLRTLGSGATQAAPGTGIAESSISGLVSDLALAGGGGAYVPTGIAYQNYSRFLGNTSAVIGPAVSGTLRMTAIWLPTGLTVASISHVSGSTALTTAGSGPHYWVALFDSSRAFLRQSTDDTAATWAANTLKTTNLSSSFLTTYTGLHYVGLLVNAGSTGTQPTLTGFSVTTSNLVALAPVLSGSSTTGLTGTAPGNGITAAIAITAGTGIAWCGVA